MSMYELKQCEAVMETCKGRKSQFSLVMFLGLSFLSS